MNLPTEEQVRAALDSLNNTVELARTPLVSCFPQIAAIEPLNERARSLRSLLLEAIEALGPPRPAPFGSIQSRMVDVLSLRYIERLSTAEMAEELSLSQRQVQRDLRRAESLLTELLVSWARKARYCPEKLDRNEDQLDQELASFYSRPSQVHLSEIVRSALATVAPLAESLHVHLYWLEAPSDLPRVLVDSAFFSQLLIQAISLAVQSTSSGAVEVRVLCEGDSQQVEIRFAASESAALQERLAAVVRAALAEAIHCDVQTKAETVVVNFRVGTGSIATVLVVEDNPGAVELYRRYLTAGPWEVRSISDPRLCYDTVRTNHPDVVVLDIMMPYLDGWRVLRKLAEDPDTSGTPVIVCSVVDDPALAHALGASAYLRKPVSQADFLSALNRCLRLPCRQKRPGHL